MAFETRALVGWRRAETRRWELSLVRGWSVWNICLCAAIQFAAIIFCAVGRSIWPDTTIA